MSNYTIELRFLNNPPMTSLFDFSYDYYMKGLVSDEVTPILPFEVNLSFTLLF